MVVMAVLLVLTLLGQVNVVLYLIRLDRRVARVEAMHGRLNALCDAYGIEEDGVVPVVLSRIGDEDE